MDIIFYIVGAKFDVFTNLSIYLIFTRAVAAWKKK